MNRFLIGLNVVLLIAVGVLFYLHFDGKGKSSQTVPAVKGPESATFKIAYFELDSLQNRYEYYKEVRDNLAAKSEQNARDLRAKQDAYMKKVKEYQQKGPTMSQTEQSQYEQTLYQMQNDLRAEQEEKQQQLNTEGMRKLQDVKLKIQDFLKGFCQEKGYSYVFAASEEDNLYFKDSTRNITDSVIFYLNAQHKSTKSK
ncbi:OmpH family outer membrane protein [Danxiaibacter flavus]|uniref:OmpH family outer membrane protein n=1 Tax=Danxiaibacter flavus TaxID=3049108 RepID=A0ABV3ZCQ9_9BACT|nr:OmpH family outer membrane protein [Chitinophagaceae bacterium DXS]